MSDSGGSRYTEQPYIYVAGVRVTWESIEFSQRRILALTYLTQKKSKKQTAVSLEKRSYELKRNGVGSI